MSWLKFNKVTTPSAPAANKARLQYVSDAPGVGSTNKIIALDESGNKAVLGGFANKDYRLIRVLHVFQGTTTYTPTNGAQALFVECIGGGGAGGGVATAATNSGAGGGGGGGAYSAVWVTGTLKSSYTVQVGAGGTPGAAGANPGGNGTDTTFDSPSVCTAKAGQGGGADTVAAGPRGAGTGGAGGAAASGVGDVKIDGGYGGYGTALAAAQNQTGAGGTAGGLGTGTGRVQNGTTGGQAGQQYGGGGGGGGIVSGGISVAGGAGGNGLMRIWEFA